jgi:hypothetical protein
MGVPFDRICREIEALRPTGQAGAVPAVPAGAGTGRDRAALEKKFHCHVLFANCWLTRSIAAKYIQVLARWPGAFLPNVNQAILCRRHDMVPLGPHS